MTIQLTTKVNFSSPIIVFDTETGGLNPNHIINWKATGKVTEGAKITGYVDKVAAPILELGAVKLDPVTLEELEVFHSLCGPESSETIKDLMSKCNTKALEINGLGNRQEELAAACPCSEVLRKFFSWATTQSRKFIPAGQNVKYDIEMINASCNRYGIDIGWSMLHQPEDLRNYSRLYFALPDTPIVANYKLTTVASALGISTVGAHTALADVRMTADCLRIMYNRLAS